VHSVLTSIHYSNISPHNVKHHKKLLQGVPKMPPHWPTSTSYRGVPEILHSLPKQQATKKYLYLVVWQVIFRPSLPACQSIFGIDSCSNWILDINQFIYTYWLIYRIVFIQILMKDMLFSTSWHCWWERLKGWGPWGIYIRQLQRLWSYDLTALYKSV